jgi:WD40 repeat protein
MLTCNPVFINPHAVRGRYAATKECDLKLDIRRMDAKCPCCKPARAGQAKVAKCRVVCAAFSPGGNLYATGGTDGVLRVHKLGGELPALDAVVEGHTAEIECLAFSHGGSRIVTGGQKGQV